MELNFCFVSVNIFISWLKTSLTKHIHSFYIKSKKKKAKKMQLKKKVVSVTRTCYKLQIQADMLIHSNCTHVIQAVYKTSASMLLYHFEV